MAKTLSQRITLEGSEEIRRQLEAIGQAGEEAFKKLAAAAKKPITDPTQFAATQQAIDDLVVAVKGFGTQGVAATKQVAAGLGATSAAAEQTATGLRSAANEATNLGVRIGVFAGLVQAATSKVLGLLNGLRTSFSSRALLEGLVKTGAAITDQADKLKTSIPKWLELRKVIRDSSLSNEDFAESGGKIADMMEKARGGVARLGAGTEQTVKVGESLVTIFRGYAAEAEKAQSETDKAATSLRKMGASGEAIATGDTLRGMREIAQTIANITDAAKRAEAGTTAFGTNWEEMNKVLLSTAPIVDSTTASLADMGRANRDMTVEQIAKGTLLKAAWKDLSEAVSATKDQVGALFLGPAQARAEWLTKLVDGSRYLLGQWIQLAEQKRATFVEGLGQTPAEIAFKILISVGQQLAGIWRDVLVPAGEKLVEIVRGIAASFEGVSASQVAAFFITAAAAAVALAVALKGIGFALTPIRLLMSLLSGIGPILLAAGALAVLFWDQIKAGAGTALAAVADLGPTIQLAMQQLFAGDFADAWNNFSGAAVAAFGRIKAAILEQNPALKAFFDELAKIATELPGAIGVVAQAFGALWIAINKVADAINFLFGTKLTGTDIALLAIVLQLTGALTVLGGVTFLVGNVLGILVSAFTLAGGAARLVLTGLGALVAAFGSLPAILGLIVVGLIALAAWLVAMNWDSIKSAAIAAWEAIKSAASDAWEAIKSGASDAWEAIKSAASDAAAAVGNAFSAVANAVGNAFTAIITGIATAITTLATGIATAITTLATGIATTISTLVTGVATTISSLVSTIATGISTAISGMSAAFATVGTAIGMAVGSSISTAIDSAISRSADTIALVLAAVPWLAFEDAGVAAANAISRALAGTISVLRQLIATIDLAIAKLQQLAAEAASGGGGAPSPSPTPTPTPTRSNGGGSNRAIVNTPDRSFFIDIDKLLGRIYGASGGLIGGRGTGTSDSNMAMVSRGEHIMPARVVRKPGVLAFLEALRAGGNLSRALDGLRGFASGGLVPAMPAFAGGGLNGMSNVTIQFPGLPAIGGLRASADVVVELQKAAAMAQVRSGGRKPSRYS